MANVVKWRTSPKLTKEVKSMIRAYVFDLMKEYGWHVEEWSCVITYQLVSAEEWDYKTNCEKLVWYSYGDALATLRNKRTNTWVEFRDIKYSATEVIQCIGPVL